MARNQETPLTFNLPDGDHVECITWDFVLAETAKRMEPILDVIGDNIKHLKAIADKLEEWASDDEEGEI